MRKFISKITWLFLSVALILAVFAAACEWLIKYHVKENAYKTRKTIFIGDSHIQLSYDDPGNLGQSSEPVMFTYYRLATILNHNKIDTVFLSVGQHSFSASNYEFINQPEVIERAFFYLPLKIRLRFLSKINYLRYVIAKSKEVLQGHTQIIGGYRPYPRNQFLFDTAYSEIRLKRQFGIPGLCSDNISYMDSIRNLCSASHTTLILLITPTHPYYNSKIPAVYQKVLADIIKSYPVLNLQHQFVNDSLFLPDGDHVSFYGSPRVTSEINKFRRGESKAYFVSPDSTRN